MGTIVVGTGDLHCNSTVGLCPPVVNMDDGGTYRGSKNQKVLWRAWLDFWENYVSKFKGDKKILVLNGDIIEQDTKRRSHQIITRNKATILKLTMDVLEPALGWADKVIVIRGTPVHTSKSGQMEEIVARDLDGVTIPSTKDVFSHYQAKLEIEGVRFDIAHHASMGGLPWTEKNAALKIAAVTMFRYNGYKLPHVVLRSHNHKWSDSGMNFWPMTVLCMPCFQLKTEYVYRLGRENDDSSIGGVVIECEKGEYKWDRKLYPITEKGNWLKI